MRYQVGTQLLLSLPSPGASDAGMDRLVREALAFGPEEGMWSGRPTAGRVEVMLIVDATDGEHAIATAVTALRSASREMGRALPTLGLRSVAAQPLGNPDDWADRDD